MGDFHEISDAQPADQESLWLELQAMPDFLEASFRTLSRQEASAPGPNDAFSPIEQCWHLADLEREGYGLRIRRLQAEADPWLPDFDGAQIARERNYKTLSLAEGLAVFREARLRNIAVLKTLGVGDWTRRGQQEGVGAVALCDIPTMMAEHDAAHRQEIQDWMRTRRERN